jgi:hypothetical protein
MSKNGMTAGPLKTNGKFIAMHMGTATTVVIVT